MFDPADSSVTIIYAYNVMLAFRGDTPFEVFGSAQALTASTGALGLNNSGGEVRLLDAMSNQIDAEKVGADTQVRIATNIGTGIWTDIDRLGRAVQEGRNSRIRLTSDAPSRFEL